MTPFFIISSDGMLYATALLAIVIAGWMLVYSVLRRYLRAELDELSIALYEHIQVAKEALEALEALEPVKRQSPAVPPAEQPVPSAAVADKPAAPTGAPPEAAAAMPKPSVAPPPPAMPLTTAAGDDVEPEVMAVISAAVAHYFGVHARIRHTRMIPMAGSNAWAQQGRVYVQASHNLAAQRAHA